MGYRRPSVGPAGSFGAICVGTTQISQAAGGPLSESDVFFQGFQQENPNKKMVYWKQKWYIFVRMHHEQTHHFRVFLWWEQHFWLGGAIVQMWISCSGISKNPWYTPVGGTMTKPTYRSTEMTNFPTIWTPKVLTDLHNFGQ